jgi:hypothetical protein
MVFDE